MEYDYIDDILSGIKESTEQGIVDKAEEEAGLRPRPEREDINDPQRRYSSGRGILEAIKGSAQAGGSRFVEELTSPLREIPGGIQQGAEALQNPDLSVLERLREVGMGGVHAGLSLGRAAFSPVTGATRAAIELPVRLAEREGSTDEQRPESVKLALDIAEMLGGAGAGAKAATKVGRSIAARRAAAKAAKDLPPEPPPGGAAGSPVEPSPAPTSPILDRLRQMEPEVAPMRQLPARTYSHGEPLRIDPATGEPIPTGPATPSRVFEFGPPGSVTGKGKIAETTPLIRKDFPENAPPPKEPAEFGPQPLGGVVRTRLGQQLVRGGRVKEPTVFGRKPSDVSFGGAADEGESVIESMRNRAKAALEAAPQIGDDIVRGAQKGPTLESIIGAENVPKLSLATRVKMAATDETKKLAHAISGSSDDLDAMPSHIREAVLASKPENVADTPSWLGKGVKDLQTRLKMKLPIFSMTHVAKGDKDFTELVSTLKAATTRQHAIEEQQVTMWNQITKMVGGRKQAEEFARKMDQRLPIPPNQGQAATLWREMWKKDAQLNSLEPGHPLWEAEYAPHFRNVVMLEKTRLVPSDSWVSVDVMKHFPSHFRPHFHQARKLNLPSDQYDWDLISGRLRGGARSAVWGTPIHHGTLEDIKPILQKLSTRSAETQDFIGNYVNYVIGHPAFRSAEGAQKMGSFIRSAEFTRTIVGNVTSPIYNSFQRILPITEVSISSAAKAARDEVRWLRNNPQLRALVKEAEIPLESLGPGKLDTEAFMGGKIRAALTKVQDIGGIPFGFAERQNRVFSFFAGYHDAVRKGATRAEAIKAGRDMIDKTQFTPGPTDRPVWMRKELGSTIGQFKYFQTKLGEYVWNNFSDMFSKTSTATQKLDAAKKFAKFWGISYGLGGPQVMPILGDWLEKHDPVGWKGALPYMGMAVTDQLGLGTVLPKDMKSLMYQIPGPALTHARDLLTALGFDPVDPTRIQDVASRVRGAVRSIPVAGVGLERARRAGITSPTGEEREPQTLAEAIPPAIGGTPIPSSRPLISRGMNRLGRLVGLNDPEQQKQFTLMTEFNRATQIKNKALADAAQALAVYDRTGADRILRDAERELGIPRGRLKVSPQSVKAQKTASQLTPLERRRKAGGKALRDYGLEDVLQ